MLYLDSYIPSCLYPRGCRDLTRYVTVIPLLPPLLELVSSYMPVCFGTWLSTCFVFVCLSYLYVFILYITDLISLLYG